MNKVNNLRGNYMRYLNIFFTITFIVFLSSFPLNVQLVFVVIGVSDIEKSIKFYQDILGLDITGIYDDITVDNADGSESFLDEVVLGYKDKPGTLLVLMNWPNDNKKYDGDIVKVVFEVENAKSVMDKIRKAGGKIDLCHYDSDKSLLGRHYAYPILWKSLNSKGLFIYDDIQDNLYFSEFVKKNLLNFVVVEFEGKFVGLIRKE